MAINPNNLSATATLTFNEDFNTLNLWNGSNGRWDTTWHYDAGKNGSTLPSNGEQEWYINANYGPTASVKPWTINNGVLDLTAAPASASIKPLINNYDYTSGMVNSFHSFTQTYGYFEMRAQLPAGQGLWPAFWLLPADGGWPPELDVMEVLGNDPTTLYTTLHSQVSGAYSTLNSKVANMSSGFHTYGVDWEPDTITWYFDGKAVHTAATPSDMHDPMYLVANLAVGGYWPGNANSGTHFPATMSIDYIRAYQPGSGGTAPAVQQPAPDPVVTTPPPSTGSSGGGGATAAQGSLTLRLSGDHFNGDPAFVVLVDGVQAGGQRTVQADHAQGQWQDVSVSGNFGTGAHQVEVRYLNDAWDGLHDRNLYVGSVAMNGHTVQGSSAISNDAAAGHEAADPSAAVMFSNGSSKFAVAAASTSAGGVSAPPAAADPTGKLTLHVSGDLYGDAPSFQVYVDGKALGAVQSVSASHSSGQWQDIALTGVDTGAHRVEVRYLNDFWDGVHDRNLYVGSIALNGQTIAGSDASSNTAAAGHESADVKAAVMFSNGSVVFDTKALASAAAPSTGGSGASSPPPVTQTADSIKFHVSGDHYGSEDPTFQVYVDGHAASGNLTVQAQHGAGEWQDLVVTGQFGPGAHDVEVRYVNDAWGGGNLDRNLYVGNINVNGHVISGASATNDASLGYDSMDPTAAVMLKNGSAIFHTDFNI